jgi:DNA-binding MurR/RpiR family transcriptional regulator
VSGESVAEQLRRRLPELAPAEGRVARALLSQYPLAGLEPLAAVATQSRASAPTVLRLVGKLGFAGYPDFQRRLRAELAARLTSPLDTMPREPSTGLVDTIRRAIGAAVTADLDRLAAEPDVAAAARLLADPRREVWVAGGRFSRVLADYLALHLQVLRAGVHRVPGDLGERHTALLDVGRRAVVVAFDYRRYQHDTIAFGWAARERGAVLVLFTDHLLSPLAATARHVLATSIDTGSPFAVLSPALAAVELLLASVVDLLGGAPRARMERHDALSTEVAGAPARPAPTGRRAEQSRP